MTESLLPIAPGTLLAGRYEVRRELGRGGMGIVYLCRDTCGDEPVALKRLHRSDADIDPEERWWFQQEARCMASLDHPAIVKARDFGILSDSSPFLVMSVAPGRSLLSWLETRAIPWPWPYTVLHSMVDQILAGLAHAHARGVIHGDLKPTNLMLDFNGSSSVPNAYILDLGLASLVRETVRPIYEELKERSKREQLLQPRVVYGYFPAQSSGNDLIVYEEDEKTERMRFTFPRQPSGKNLCLADFFASKESGRMDVVAFHLVTMGRRASEYAHELFKRDNYADYLYFHGLSVESAEAMAELWHRHIRQELGIADNDSKNLNELFRQGYQGSRFSFGYPACPNLEDQTKLFELLDPARIDVELTEEFQLEPEQSTSAIVIHHPEARYFSID